RGVLGVPSDLFGQAVFGVVMEIAIEAVFLERYVLDQADAVAKAPPLAGVYVIDVDPHTLVHREGLLHHGLGVLAAFLANRPQKLYAGDNTVLAIDAERYPAVVGVFLQDGRFSEIGCGWHRLAPVRIWKLLGTSPRSLPLAAGRVKRHFVFALSAPLGVRFTFR